jgi:hypothetical protein
MKRCLALVFASVWIALLGYVLTPDLERWSRLGPYHAQYEVEFDNKRAELSRLFSVQRVADLPVETVRFRISEQSVDRSCAKSCPMLTIRILGNDTVPPRLKPSDKISDVGSVRIVAWEDSRSIVRRIVVAYRTPAGCSLGKAITGKVFQWIGRTMSPEAFEDVGLPGMRLIASSRLFDTTYWLTTGKLRFGELMSTATLAHSYWYLEADSRSSAKQRLPLGFYYWEADGNGEILHVGAYGT